MHFVYLHPDISFAPIAGDIFHPRISHEDHWNFLLHNLITRIRSLRLFLEWSDLGNPLDDWAGPLLPPC
jgi:hypothetical protein